VSAATPGGPRVSTLVAAAATLVLFLIYMTIVGKLEPFLAQSRCLPSDVLIRSGAKAAGVGALMLALAGIGGLCFTVAGSDQASGGSKLALVLFAAMILAGAGVSMAAALGPTCISSTGLRRLGPFGGRQTILPWTEVKQITVNCEAVDSAKRSVRWVETIEGTTLGGDQIALINSIEAEDNDVPYARVLALVSAGNAPITFGPDASRCASRPQ
jgi:hypothetical protein